MSFFFMFLVINPLYPNINSKMVDYSISYPPNNILGSGNLLRDPVYKAQCSLLKCPSGCCYGILSTHIICGTTDFCNELKLEKESDERKKLILSIVISISFYLLISLIICFVWFKCTCSCKNFIICYIIIIFFPILLFSVLLKLCGCIEYSLFDYMKGCLNNKLQKEKNEKSVSIQMNKCVLVSKIR